MLRTWGNPLFTLPDRTFVGAELKISFTGRIGAGVGYYLQLSDSGDEEQEQFWGFHPGVGIQQRLM